ncbi:DUF3311 domain-containing protein [Rosistilla oblonga]|uniref:DUF3311 domain-containing protein n=1 Tax=Rosistilla oblonga TaxID=2527990 RepID=UPI003A972DEE
MKYLIWFLIVVLVVLHQDYWQWNNATLDFGFLPRAISYHVGISIAAATLWLLATKYCWPDAAIEGELKEGDR